MTVNRTSKFNNDALISAAGTAIVGGAGFALAGYESKPWLKNGVPSDEFVNKVEEKLLANVDKAQAADVRLYDKFMENIGKAKSYEELADVNLKYFTEQKLSLAQIKQGIQNQILTILESMYSGSSGSDSGLDEVLDYYNAVKKSSNIGELKSALVDNLKQSSAGMGFDFVKGKVKGMYEFFGVMSGLDTRLSAQEAIGSSFDVLRQNFNKKPDNVSKEMFDIVKNTAKRMQYKTAGLCALLGGAAFGTVVYLVNKLCMKKTGRKMPSKIQAGAQKNVQIKTNAPAEIKPQNNLPEDGNLLRKKLSGNM